VGRRGRAVSGGLPDSVRTTLEHELRLIEKLHYAPYFLTVNSIIRFARSNDILCQGRGSACRRLTLTLHYEVRSSSNQVGTCSVTQHLLAFGWEPAISI
jgi:hypothetical protein